MTSSQTAVEPCHNCRRRRLKCDRTLPHCLKCEHKGQECLGYQRLLRWEQGVASRGKLAGTTFGEINRPKDKDQSTSTQPLEVVTLARRHSPRDLLEALSPVTLTDPLLQDLDQSTRRYLFYFASHVCKDLVLYDVPHHNHFRDLIPLTYYHPILRQVIIANAALHMTNATHRIQLPASLGSSISQRVSLLTSPASSTDVVLRPSSYDDALAAKQRALHLLKSSLANINLADIDVTLAVVLLFIEFELIDSGKDNWKYHINGARTVINMLLASRASTQSSASPLRSFLISNCLVFDIIGSSLASSIGITPSIAFSSDAHTLLSDAEGNHCSSFPTTLLQVLQAGGNFSRVDSNSLPLSESQQLAEYETLLQLLQTAKTFDPVSWATSLQPVSPTDDTEMRTHIGFAHRAAVIIYLSRVLFSLYPSNPLADDLSPWIEDVIRHLSFIFPEHQLFKATPWPTFIAGAETTDTAQQEWVLRRFEQLWEVEPWGLIKGTLGVLEGIWAGRESQAASMAGEHSPQPRGSGGDWLDQLRSRGVDWLII